VFHRIDDHFGVAIPQVKSINPFGNADWEGVGVEPDVKVEASNALETAVKIMLPVSRHRNPLFYGNQEAPTALRRSRDTTLRIKSIRIAREK
jgi:hypothetical protein